MGMIKYFSIILILAVLEHAVYADSNDIGAFGSRLINEFPSTVISDACSTFTRTDNLAALLIAGGASIALHNTDADKNINDNLHHRAFEDSTSDFFDIAGNPGVHLGATGIWYLYSSGTGDSAGKENAWTMLSALAITDAAAFSLKYIVDTERPNDHSHAFPSAHTASSFCAASVLDEFYGPEIGIPAYIGAAFVGWRMMDAGDHWASDVLFGGTLGYVVGHTVGGKHKIEIAGFNIEPMIPVGQYPANGIVLVKRF